MEVHKVTLGSGKVCLFRPLKIKDTALATKAAGAHAGDDVMSHQVYLQQELTKLLLVQVDGKDVPAEKREDLDALFTVAEYAQVQKYIMQQLDGGQDPSIEVVSSGGK